MSTMHEKLRNVYNKYVMDILDERTRKENNLKPYNLRLVLPGEDEDFMKMFENEEENEKNNDEHNDNFKSPTLNGGMGPGSANGTD
jgi:hypothetical protein